MKIQHNTPLVVSICLCFLLVCFSHLSIAQIVVTNTDDTGPGSLRQAIIDANNDGVPSTINFNLPNALDTIKITSSLPTITDAVTIDGSTQPNSSAPVHIRTISLHWSFNTIYANEVDGFTMNNCKLSSENSSSNLLTIENSSNILLEENTFVGAGSSGYQIINYSDNILIRNNKVGVDTDGITPLTTSRGFELGHCTNATIKGNIIGNTEYHGILLHHENNNITIENNFIGTDANEQFVFPLNNTDGDSGIEIWYTNDNVLIKNNTIAHGDRGILSRVDADKNIDISQNNIYCNELAGIESIYSTAIPIPTLTYTTPDSIVGNSQANYTIEVFKNDNGDCTDAPCQGRTYIGTTTADANGHFKLLGSFTIGEVITATATDPNSSTSEFAACKTVSELMYPGDANRDGKVNAEDILIVGLLIGQKGTTRPNASSHPSYQSVGEDWATSMFGINAKYADSDGDGDIDIHDINIIHANYNAPLDHTTEIDQGNSGSDSNSASAPSLEIVEIGYEDDMLNVNVIVQDNESPENPELYSVIFTLRYEQAPLDAEVFFEENSLGIQDQTMKGIYKLISDLPDTQGNSGGLESLGFSAKQAAQLDLDIGATSIEPGKGNKPLDHLCRIGCIIQVIPHGVIRSENYNDIVDGNRASGKTSFHTAFDPDQYEPFVINLDNIKIYAQDGQSYSPTSKVDTFYIRPYNYCIPDVLTSNNPSFINSLTIQDMDEEAIYNLSGQDNGRGHFLLDSALHINTQIGVPYDFKMDASINNSQKYSHQIWVDLDQSESFEENELLHTIVSDESIIKGQLTIPSDAMLGATVMRIVTSQGSPTNDPCASINNGEVEDYWINIHEPDHEPVQIDISIENIINCDSNQGDINITASGGAAPYTFTLNDNGFQKDGYFTDLENGQHIIKVIDANGCEAKKEFKINNPEPISFIVDQIDCTSKLSYRCIRVDAKNGTGPYQYSVDNGRSWHKENIFINLQSNSFIVSVKDANGCIVSQKMSLVKKLKPLKIFPNPATTTTNISLRHLSKHTTGTLSICDRHGNTLYEIAKVDTRDNTPINLSSQKFQPGVYFVCFISKEGDTYIAKLLII